MAGNYFYQGRSAAIWKLENSARSALRKVTEPFIDVFGEPARYERKFRRREYLHNVFRRGPNTIKFGNFDIPSDARIRAFGAFCLLLSGGVGATVSSMYPFQTTEQRSMISSSRPNKPPRVPTRNIPDSSLNPQVPTSQSDIAADLGIPGAHIVGETEQGTLVAVPQAEGVTYIITRVVRTVDGPTVISTPVPPGPLPSVISVSPTNTSTTTSATSASTIESSTVVPSTNASTTHAPSTTNTSTTTFLTTTTSAVPTTLEPTTLVAPTTTDLVLVP